MLRTSVEQEEQATMVRLLTSKALQITTTLSTTHLVDVRHPKIPAPLKMKLMRRRKKIPIGVVIWKILMTQNGQVEKMLWHPVQDQVLPLPPLQPKKAKKRHFKFNNILNSTFSFSMPFAITWHNYFGYSSAVFALP